MDMGACSGSLAPTQLNNISKTGRHVSSLSTFTYLVEDVFAEGQPSLRRQILSIYPEFYRTLVASPSKELRMLLNMVKNEPIPTTCRNLCCLRTTTQLETVESYSSWRVREAISIKKVPENEKWRLGLLASLIDMICV